MKPLACKPFLISISTLALAIGATSNAYAEQSTSPAEFIELFEQLSGKHPGMRKAHAPGICASGNFVPNKALSKYSSSALFDADSVPATIRFSLGSGNISADERAPGARGMAIQLKLEDGSIHNIVGNSTPVFAAKDPDTFFGLLKTFLPDENGNVDRAKIGQYIATHPSTQPLAKWQQTTAAPYSYSSSEFYGLHTFYFEDEEGELTKFRWHTTPDRGIRLLTKQDQEETAAQFLNERLKTEMQDGSISYTINVAIGTAEDTTNDPSQSWPEDREVMEFGKLTLTDVGGETCTPINFDPNVMASGFKASDDPVLKMRSPAYAISFGKRLSGQ